RERGEDWSDFRVDLFEPSQNSVVLLDAEGAGILAAPGPFRLHRHPSCSSQHVYELRNLLVSFHCFYISYPEISPLGRRNSARNPTAEDINDYWFLRRPGRIQCSSRRVQLFTQ